MYYVQSIGTSKDCKVTISTYIILYVLYSIF